MSNSEITEAAKHSRCSWAVICHRLHTIQHTLILGGVMPSAFQPWP